MAIRMCIMVLAWSLGVDLEVEESLWRGEFVELTRSDIGTRYVGPSLTDCVWHTGTFRCVWGGAQQSEVARLGQGTDVGSWLNLGV